MRFLFSLLFALFVMAPVGHAAVSNANNVQTQILDLGSITADADTYGFYFPKKAKIISAKVVNGGGISQSDSNYAVVTLQNGSTVYATHSTQLTGGTSALTANTPAAMTLNTTYVSNGGVNVDAGSWLKVTYDETGTYGMTTAKVIVTYYQL
jgi:hypothetical protein